MTLDKVKLKTINNTSIIGDGNISIDESNFEFDEIPQGDDLDNYTYQGAFFTNAYSTISNVPVIQPFVLTVDSNINGNAIQTFFDLANNEIYTRTCYNGVFSEWKSKLNKSQEIPNNADLNDYTTEGFYHCGRQMQDVATIQNNPSGRAFSLLVEKSGFFYSAGYTIPGVKQTVTRADNLFTWQRTIWQETVGGEIKTTDWQVVWAYSDWAEVSYESGYGRYDSGTGVFYRRRGNVVEITGVWKPTSNKNNSDTAVTFATIPSGYRPSRVVRGRMQASGMNTYLLTVATNGELQWSRHGTTSGVQMPSTSWNNVQVTYTLTN